MGLPRAGTKVCDLKCKVCGKTVRERKSKGCDNPNCPNKPKKAK